VPLPVRKKGGFTFVRFWGKSHILFEKPVARPFGFYTLENLTITSRQFVATNKFRKIKLTLSGKLKRKKQANCGLLFPFARF
jgi:hypothetical protein